MEFGEVVMTGWALASWEDPEQMRFLVNGSDFKDLQWPLPSPDLAGLFDALPEAGFARFQCHQRAADGQWPSQGGFTRLNVTSQFGEHAQSYRTAWYMPAHEEEAAMPDDAEIAAEAGTGGSNMYRAGGATLAVRLDTYLRQRLARGISEFDSVLEWGCGGGRVTRYLSRMHERLTAIDTDENRLALCAARLPSVRCLAIDRLEGLPFEAAAFDLVIAPFVAHALDEASQRIWLEELRRITRAGGVVLASIWGRTLAQLHQDWGPRHLAAHRLGLYAQGADPALDATLTHTGHYNGVRHSHDYVLATWDRYFEVIEIVPGMVHAHDLVVLRARNGDRG